MSALEIKIPVPPSVNNIYTSRYKGRGRTLTKEGREYKRDAGWIAKKKALEERWYYNGGRLHIELLITFPNNRRRDITNCIKIAEDAVAEALGFDDTVVDSVLIRRVGIDAKDPHALLRLREER